MDFSGSVKAALLLVVAAYPARAASPQPAPTCRPAALWLISTRGLPCGLSDADALASLDYWRCGSDGWEPAQADDFQQQTQGGRLTYFVHGNWITSSQAFGMGAPVRDALSPDAASPQDAVVIWSWPSAQDSRRRLADVREKAGRSEAQGRYLAAALRARAGERTVALVGYSYGARLITSALQHHGAEGGSRAPVTAVLMAAALDDHWLLPGHRHGDALSGIRRLLVLVNSQDPVLERYRYLYGRRSGAQALGYAGFPCAGEFPSVEQWRVDCYVGPSHDWGRYIHSCPVADRVREFIHTSAATDD